VSKHQGRLCALVVDDNFDVAESFAKMLVALGCEAAYVTDPRQALDEALKRKPHIAFLDIGMPHMDGYALARELRKHFSSERLKLVAVTGYGGPDDRKASRQAGFDAHVKKPVDPKFVESIIKTLLPEN
jgi:CheY-like chemotaxis protein